MTVKKNTKEKQKVAKRLTILVVDKILLSDYVGKYDFIDLTSESLPTAFNRGRFYLSDNVLVNAQALVNSEAEILDVLAKKALTLDVLYEHQVQKVINMEITFICSEIPEGINESILKECDIVDVV